ELLEATDNVLSVQVLQEFYVQCTRASRTDTLPHEVAVGLIDAWLRYPIVGSSVDLLRRGLDLRARYTWSYRDAAVVAAALDAGCTELMTEDLNRGLKVDGLTIVDPFVDH